MTDETIPDVKEIDNCLDANPSMMSEERSKETEPVVDVVSKDQEVCIPETNEVPKPQGVIVRRLSTGSRPCKPQVKSRYRGDHHVSSIHDACKHGDQNKKCDHNDAVKPWNMVMRKSVDGSESSSSLSRKSVRSVSKPIPVPKTESSSKRDVLAVKKKPSSSVTSGSSSVKEGSEKARSVDGLSVDNKARKKNIEAKNVMNGSALVIKKPNTAMEKVSRVSGGESSKVSPPKNLMKKKEKAISEEDVKENSVCVVESNVKGVQREKKSITSLTKKKQSESTNLEANPKTEKKIRPKSLGVKVTLPKQLSFKKGKVLEPKPDNSSPRWLKFRKRVVKEQKTETEEQKKKNLKASPLVAETKTEDSKREKVALKHQNSVGRKKKGILYNKVIEETMSKLIKVRKTRVKALIGAFENVISIQNSKASSKRVQRKAVTSPSRVSPNSGFEQ